MMTPTLFVSFALCATLLAYTGLWLHQRLAHNLGIRVSTRSPWVSPKGFVGWASRVGLLLILLIATSIGCAVYVAAPPIVGRLMAIIVTAMTIRSSFFKELPRLLAAGARKKEVGLWLAVSTLGFLCGVIIMFWNAGALWRGR